VGRLQLKQPLDPNKIRPDPAPVQQASILIFAKFPHAGQVKTRLVPPLSFEQAATWHEAAMRAVCERAAYFKQNIAKASRYDINVVLVGAPNSQLDSFRKLNLTGINDYWPQGEGHLGQRLSRAVDRAFDHRADAVVLLGADSPTLPQDHLLQSLSLLESNDVAISPTHDGGYCLLSLRSPCQSLFEKIDWGSSTVADQTRTQARAAKLALAELPPWYDIDSFDDLEKMVEDFDVDELTMLESSIALRQLTHELLTQV